METWHRHYYLPRQGLSCKGTSLHAPSQINLCLIKLPQSHLHTANQGRIIFQHREEVGILAAGKKIINLPCVVWCVICTWWLKYLEVTWYTHKTQKVEETEANSQSLPWEPLGGSSRHFRQKAGYSLDNSITKLNTQKQTRSCLKGNFKYSIQENQSTWKKPMLTQSTRTVLLWAYLLILIMTRLVWSKLTKYQ